MVMHGWQSEPTDGPKGGWNLETPIYLSIDLSFFSYLSFPPSICRSIYASIFLSISQVLIYLCVYPSKCLSMCFSVSVSSFLFLSFEIYPFPCLSVCLSICPSIQKQPFCWEINRSEKIKSTHQTFLLRSEKTQLAAFTDGLGAQTLSLASAFAFRQFQDTQPIATSTPTLQSC